MSGTEQGSDQHPDAEENIGKAHVEAAAGSRRELDAVDASARANDLARESQEPYAPARKSIKKLQAASNFLRGAEATQSAARADEDSAGVRFDQAQEIIDQTKPRS